MIVYHEAWVFVRNSKSYLVRLFKTSVNASSEV